MVPLLTSASESDLQASQSVQGLQNQIERLLETNLELCKRMRQLEDVFDARSLVAGLTNSETIREITHSEEGEEDGDDDGTLTAMPLTVNLGALTVNQGLQPSFRHAFEGDLESSRVYRRTRFYPTDRDTFMSSIARTHAWSIFSGLSLSEISIVSVIALPLLLSEISNRGHYEAELPQLGQLIPPRQPFLELTFKLWPAGNFGHLQTATSTADGQMYAFGKIGLGFNLDVDLRALSITDQCAIRPPPRWSLPATGRGYRISPYGKALVLLSDMPFGQEAMGDGYTNLLYLFNYCKLPHQPDVVG